MKITQKRAPRTDGWGANKSLIVRYVNIVNIGVTVNLNLKKIVLPRQSDIHGQYSNMRMGGCMRLHLFYAIKLMLFSIYKQMFKIVQTIKCMIE